MQLRGCIENVSLSADDDENVNAPFFILFFSIVKLSFQPLFMFRNIYIELASGNSFSFFFLFFLLAVGQIKFSHHKIFNVSKAHNRAGIWNFTSQNIFIRSINILPKTSMWLMAWRSMKLFFFLPVHPFNFSLYFFVFIVNLYCFSLTAFTYSCSTLFMLLFHLHTAPPPPKNIALTSFPALRCLLPWWILSGCSGRSLLRCGGCWGGWETPLAAAQAG